LKWADLWDAFINSSKGVCTSTIVVSPDPDDLKQADEGDIQMEYFSA
jgi:hypothetical protein